MATVTVLKGTNKKKKSWVLRIAILAFSAYMLVMLMQLRLEIDEAEKQLAELESNIAVRQNEVEEAEHQRKDPDKLLEKKAYEMGYGYPGEAHYQESPAVKND